MRSCNAPAIHPLAEYDRLRELYRVEITNMQIGGVDIDVFVPVQGVSSRNQRRVLINVHGGVESIPIAALGNIKVVSIASDPAREYSAAAASVAAVYKQLIQSYRPANIGIYGCSIGGSLTAAAIAWLLQQRLPRPGAAGMFCDGAHHWPVLPGRSPAAMAGFPPSLLITGTRDFGLSAAVHTHSVLVSHGVTADLHIWEDWGHGRLRGPELPRSKEVYAVIVKFFDFHLGI